MKIVVLNGSPKGDLSVSLHYALYLEKHFLEDNFDFFNVSKDIKIIEKNENYLNKILDKIKVADLLLWVYPVYTSLVPYQLMRFIEMIFKISEKNHLKGKYTSQISTSKHFFDNTAHFYIHQISESLGMKYIQGHTADMDDLLKEEGRKQLIDFFKEIKTVISNKEIITKKFNECIHSKNTYKAVNKSHKKIKSNYKIILFYNGESAGENLMNMIDTYDKNLEYEIDKIDLSKIKIIGGCIGCVKCAFTGHCFYKDDFESFHRNNFASADMIIYASDIRNHWMDPIFKLLIDRSFYNGHRISLAGKGVAYIFSGPLRKEPNIDIVIQGRAEVAKMYLVDIVTDEDFQDITTKKISDFCLKTKRFLEHKPSRTPSFLGVGGMKIFRDLVYEMRNIMIEDHKFYKKEKLYDFPKKRILLNGVIYFPMKFMKTEKVFKKISPKLSTLMISRYRKILEEK